MLQIPYADSHFYSSRFPSGLVNRVAGFERSLSTSTNPSVTLAVPSVHSQDCRGSPRCLPVEGAPVRPSLCSQGVYQTPGSCSSALVPAGMSHVPLHR